MSKDGFKYKTKLTSTASYDVVANKDGEICFANQDLSELRALLPEQEVIDSNDDLTYTAFNAAVANLVNLNDDAITTETALKINDGFIGRYMNIEHMRDYVVGHIISAGFTEFGTNKIITAEELEGTNKPFNMALGAIVWKVVSSFFSEVIQESSENGDDSVYGTISTSWEIGFNEFIIAEGSKKLSDAKLITDDAEIEEKMQYLRAEGGTGMLPDGTPIYRVIVGEDVKALGCGFTFNPAAAVKGVITASEEGKQKYEELVKSVEEKVDQLNEAVASILEKNKKTEKNKEKNKKQSVKANKMKILKIEDITTEALTEVSASEIRKFIGEKLEEAVSKSAEEKKELQDAAEAKEKEHDDALEAVKSEVEAKDGEVKDLGDKVIELEAKVAEFEKREAEAKAEKEYQDRLTEVKTEFELSEAQEKVVAKQLKSVDSDEAFASWKEDFTGLFVKASGEENNDDLENKLDKTNTTATASVPSGISRSEDDIKALREEMSEVVK